MNIKLPLVFSNKIDNIGVEIQSALVILIKKMMELELTVTGYEFHTDNGDKVKVKEVLIEDGILSFAVEESLDDDFGYNCTVSAYDIPTKELLSLYTLYYHTNISTINSAG